MLQHECSAIRDLLPLYAQNQVQPETAGWISDHLLTCPVCAEQWEKLQVVNPKSCSAASPPDRHASLPRRLLRQLTPVHWGLPLMALMIFLHCFPWLTTAHGHSLSYLPLTLPGMFIALFFLAFPRYNLPGAILATPPLLLLPLGSIYLFSLYPGTSYQYFSSAYWAFLLAALLLTALTLFHLWHLPLARRKANGNRHTSQ